MNMPASSSAFTSPVKMGTVSSLVGVERLLDLQPSLLDLLPLVPLKAPLPHVIPIPTLLPYTQTEGHTKQALYLLLN